MKKHSTETLRERLFRNFEENDRGCWLWKGGKVYAGYGSVRLSGRNLLAHRAMWLCLKGDIPGSKIVCHTCDTPGCINPDHLFLGTYADNTADMVNKGRQGEQLKGESNPRHKLSAEQVKEIRYLRQEGFSWSALEEKFGVCRGTLQRIVKFRTWKHV
jgi:hypothetical protein